MSWSLPQVSTAPFCPSEVRGSISIRLKGSPYRKFLTYVGPGLLVVIGYVDPGNWVTDIQRGAAYGYTLLSVIFPSNLIAILLQVLCVRLGIAPRMDLAQLCRHHFSTSVNAVLWLFAEVAIAACELAEILGSALALNLLVKIPLFWGVLITGLDVMIVLLLQGKGVRWLEAIVLGLVANISFCLLIEIGLAKPLWSEVLLGYLPQLDIVRQPDKLYLALGILGAIVMPHNLYLRTALAQTRNWGNTAQSQQEVVRYANWDAIIALSGAFLINSAILILATATFHISGNRDGAEIQDAYRLIAPLLSTTTASILFGLALLVSGQSSALTGTIAGQVVMEGSGKWCIPCWQRRLLTSYPLLCFLGCFLPVMGKLTTPYWLQGLA